MLLSKLTHDRVLVVLFEWVGWRWQVASVDPLVVYVHNDGLARLATKVSTVSAHRAVMKFHLLQ